MADPWVRDNVRKMFRKVRDNAGTGSSDQDPMLALTLYAEWAWAMAWAGKAVENRLWTPPKAFCGRQIAIHAGRKVDREALARIVEECGVRPAYGPVVGPELGFAGAPERGQIVLGAVVAVGTLAGWVREDGSGYVGMGLRGPDGAVLAGAEVLRRARVSRWWNGPVGWIVTSRVALGVPVKCRGKQGLWRLDAETEATVRVQVGMEPRAQDGGS